MKTINFHNPLNVVKGFYGGIISTNTNIKPEVGEVIVCTAKEGDFALGMVGRCKGEGTLEKGQEVFGSDCSSRIFLVDWKVFPKKIPATFNAVEGGHILLDDRAEVVSNILLEDEE